MKRRGRSHLGNARAQQPAKVHRIAIVGVALPIAELTETSSLPFYRAFFHELRRFGYIEGRNLIVERYSVERPTVELARDVVRSKPDVMFSLAPWVFILKPLTTIPIVASMPDPVGFGLVASLAHPGGNITGVSVDAGPKGEAKRLELLKEAFPQASRSESSLPDFRGGVPTASSGKWRLKDCVFCYLPPGWAPIWRQSIDVFSR
jgi:ABC transporter substrate binding protein